MQRRWQCYRGIALALVAVAASTLGAAQAQAATDAKAAIREALETWRKDFNSQNPAKICDLFAPDLVADFQGQPQRNFGQICDLLVTSLANPKRRYSYNLDIKEIIVSGDLAVARLVWILEIKSDGGAQPQTLEQPAMDVFRRETDGSWRIIRFLGYSKAS